MRTPIRFTSIAIATQLIAAACGGKASPGVVAGPAASAPSGPAVAAAASANADSVREYERCWSVWNDQWEQLESCYDDAIVSEEPGSGSPPWVGLKAVEGHAALFKHVFPDARGEIQLILSNGAHTAGIALVRGTHDGDMRQPGGVIEPSHKPLSIFVGHVLERGESGKSTSELIFIDHASLWGQLGRFPGPHRAAADRGWPERQVAVASGDASEERNVNAYRKLLEAINRRDAEAISAAYAPGLTWSNSSLPMDLDRSTAIAFFGALWAGFSDLRMTADAPWAAGDYVVAVGEIRGTNDGDLPALGLRGSGRKLALPYLEITRYRDGLVEASWLFYDSMGLFAQLGLGG